GGWSGGEIQPVGPPAIPAEDWHDPAAVLDRLRGWAQQHTTEAIRWYLRDKQAKRAGSRLLRAAAVILAVAGGLIPLLAGDAGRGPNPKLGYLLLALSAGAVAFDHFFGLSAGWMRDIATAQALQARLARFHLDWATWQATEAGLLKPATPAEENAGGVQQALDLIGHLVTDVHALTEAETAQWVNDFNSSL